MGSKQYVKKSEKFRGVYQRKNGTWFYRVKRIIDGKPVYYQTSGFDSEYDAYIASIDDWYTDEYQGKTYNLCTKNKV